MERRKRRRNEGMEWEEEKKEGMTGKGVKVRELSGKTKEE